MTDSKWTIRPAKGEDLSFIYSTWSNSYRYGSSTGKSCRNSVFFPEFNRVMDSIMGDPNTRVLVAEVANEPGVVLGYLVYEPNLLHYAFVKEAFRKQGIAMSLFLHAGGSPSSFYTHRTFVFEDLLKRKPELKDLKYNPFKLFYSIKGETKWPKRIGY